MNYQLKKCLNLKQLSILALFVVSNTSQAHIPKVLPPDFSEPQLNSLVKTNKVKELDELAAKLPQELRLNFVLKHGVKRQGERGHLVETKVSQSSDPDLPRVILWNERTGFSRNGDRAVHILRW